MAVVATYPRLSSDWLRHELDSNLNREEITIPAGSGVLASGAVLGRISKGTATSAAKSGGNTGNGALTLDATTPLLATAVTGVYTVRCITAAGNGGTFRVESPDGLVMGDVAVGATFSDQIKFAIADGGADFIVGDGFDITVAAGSGKCARYNPTLLNGRGSAAGILLDAVDASGGSDVKGVMVSGEAVIVAQHLEWDASVDDQTKKNTALAQLAKLGFKTRTVA